MYTAIATSVRNAWAFPQEAPVPENEQDNQYHQHQVAENSGSRPVDLAMFPKPLRVSMPSSLAEAQPPKPGPLPLRTTSASLPSPHPVLPLQVVPKSQEEWILSSEVGLQFMRPFQGKLTCVACKETYDESHASNSGPVFRSVFWKYCECHASHKQRHCVVAADDAKPGVCKRCDKDYVLKVVRGEYTCAREDCRRALKPRKDAIDDALWDHPGLVKKFFALVHKCNVYECSIHADEVGFDDGSAGGRSKITDECDHERNVCNPCLALMCESAIKSNRLVDLACPEPQCRKRLNREAIRRLVSADGIKLYDKKLAFVAMARNPKFQWCACGHGQIHEPGEESPEWRCASCDKRHCFLCREDDDGDVASLRLCEHLERIDQERARQRAREQAQREQTERERAERQRAAREAAARQRALAVRAIEVRAREVRENTRGTRSVIRTTAKRCPRQGCEAPIQRDAGCAHMTCSNCRTEFCWSCKVIWKMGMYDGAEPALAPLHLTSCRVGESRTIEKDQLNTRQYARGWDVDLEYDLSQDVGLWLPTNQR